MPSGCLHACPFKGAHCAMPALSSVQGLNLYNPTFLAVHGITAPNLLTGCYPAPQIQSLLHRCAKNTFYLISYFRFWFVLYQMCTSVSFEFLYNGCCAVLVLRMGQHIAMVHVEFLVCVLWNDFGRSQLLKPA